VRTGRQSRNPREQEKTGRKSTYPPPADGVCVLFLCKVGCSANEPVAQAGCGALQATGNFTDCEVLRGNAASLHSGACVSRREAIAGVPGFIGGKFEKPQSRHLFRLGTACIKTESEQFQNILKFAGSQTLQAFRPIKSISTVCSLLARPLRV